MKHGSTKKERTPNLKWIFYVALRYISKKASRSSASSLLAILEIATGVLALTVIIAVMNGFQLSYIESILEVSSYYVRIDNLPETDLDMSWDIKNIPGIQSVSPFKETDGILRGNYNGTQSPVVLRGLLPDVFSTDRGFGAHIEILESVFENKNELLTGKNSIMLGSELARRLGITAGDTVEYLSISDLFSSEEVDEDSLFRVTGIFKTGYYEYDLGWGFINIKRALELEKSDAVTLGIKLYNRYHDIKASEEITALILKTIPHDVIEYNNITVSSWRDYNKAFFGALRTEKLMMFVLVGLIFVVVALNIFQSQRRTVLERNEEIGLLCAVGASNFQVRCVFTFNGLLIGLIGASSGMILAVLIATNIQTFFAGIEAVISAFIHLVYRLTLGVLFSDTNFAIFNSKIFYLDSITARLMVSDVVLIYLFGLLSAVFAAWFASRRTAKIKPADILRYE
jgi:lipoprotein-releasing system permease protein